MKNLIVTIVVLVTLLIAAGLALPSLDRLEIGTSPEIKNTSTFTPFAPVPATSTPTVTLAKSTSQSAHIEAPVKQLDPKIVNLLTETGIVIPISDLNKSEDYVASFAPLIESVVKSSDYAQGEPLLTRLAAKDTEIPEITNIGSPCLKGESSFLTGYDWLSHEYHTAVDIACPVRVGGEGENNWFAVGAPTRCVVWATIFSEAEANKINGSGTTILCKAKISEAYGTEGNIVFGFSHMDNNINVVPGQIVEQGEQLGIISRFGTTGNTTGIHLHYTVIWEHSDGSLEYLNPNNWGAIGGQIAPEPTLPVTLDNIPNDFAHAHVKLEELPFLSWKTTETTAVIPGDTGGSQTQTVKQVSVSATECNGNSVLDNVRRVFQAFRDEDWHAIGAMILTESGFKQFVSDGNGGCKLLQNYAGAPAYCMTQIYAPAHPNIIPQDLADIDYCISVGHSVYKGMLSTADGDYVQAVACYKGFCQPGMNGKYEPDFIANFMGAYNASGFYVENTFIPWDKEELLKVFPDW